MTDSRGAWQPLTWQPTLSGTEPPAPDETFASLERIILGAGSWVDYGPGWMAGADALFTEVMEMVDWAQRRRWMYQRRVNEPRPHGGGASRALTLGRGDLLVTGGQTQRRWEHTVPKVARAGARISVAFRHMTPAGQAPAASP